MWDCLTSFFSTERQQTTKIKNRVRSRKSKSIINYIYFDYEIANLFCLQKTQMLRTVRTRSERSMNMNEFRTVDAGELRERYMKKAPMQM